MSLAYLDFARTHPALYEAMFTLPTSLRFADAGAALELKDAFAALAVVAPTGCDRELTTETFWAVLHGMAELERSGRIRPSARAARVALVIEGLIGG